ncbi:AAA family ATPase [Chloroflexota bacterium]
MIPVRLRVRNFMCYRDDVAPLEFEGIHLACLTGGNGHGKSALLDAMTWALWGKARARRDDDLIHLGEAEMEVEFTFSLGGTVYRVLRKRESSRRLEKRVRPGRTILDVQVQSPDGTGSYDSIAEPTVRASQAALNRLLRMDYDTFTNSAFLLQGKADAFTTQTPAERKQVLAQILGLSRYDEYEQRAKEQVREIGRQVAELEGLLQDIDRELGRRSEYEEELKQAEAAVDELSSLAKDAESKLRDLGQELQHLEHQQVQLQDLDRRLARGEREVQEIEARIPEHQERLAEYDAILLERTRVEEGYAAWNQSRADEAMWNETLARYAQGQGQQHALQRAVAAARNELELAASRLSERIRELEQRAAEISSHELQLSEVRSQLARLDQLNKERDSAQEHLQTLGEETAALRVRNGQLREAMDGLKEKLELLRQESGEARCPLCTQELTDEHRDHLLIQLETEGKELGDTHRENSARDRENAAAIDDLHRGVQRLDRELAQLPSAQRRDAQLEHALSNAQQAATHLVETRSQLSALHDRLMSGDYATPEQTELAHLTTELEALGYDSVAHKEVKAKAQNLAKFEAAQQRLQTAVERRDEEKNALEELEARLARWLESLADDRALKESLAMKVARLPEVSDQARASSQKVDELRTRSSKARLALGAAQQKLEHCRYLASERERRSSERRRLTEEKAVFEELQLAFGKKGIQAMIIEAAIPEIEFEANRLLARMTEGRMHVRMETQRETLKGSPVETLDINIADELGTRPYELFSGGESFRVDFAIRIALSKLLARRAGAQLQTLVIDEGFGTQDAEGRQRLVEAINSVEADFARILVITHIEELKDAFPVHIKVTKTSNGSQFRLS